LSASCPNLGGPPEGGGRREAASLCPTRRGRCWESLHRRPRFEFDPWHPSSPDDQVLSRPRERPSARRAGRQHPGGAGRGGHQDSACCATRLLCALVPLRSSASSRAMGGPCTRAPRCPGNRRPTDKACSVDRRNCCRRGYDVARHRPFRPTRIGSGREKAVHGQNWAAAIGAPFNRHPWRPRPTHLEVAQTQAAANRRSSRPQPRRLLESGARRRLCLPFIHPDVNS